MSQLHRPASHASADDARACPTCQVDARESVALLNAQLWARSESSSVSPEEVTLAPIVERSTRVLDHITLAFGIFVTALVLILAALQIARWLSSGGN